MDAVALNTAAINAFAHHLNEVCTECRRHRGHVPLGLCPEGLKLFQAMDEEPRKLVSVPNCKPGRDHEWEPLYRCTCCGFLRSGK